MLRSWAKEEKAKAASIPEFSEPELTVRLRDSRSAMLEARLSDSGVKCKLWFANLEPPHGILVTHAANPGGSWVVVGLRLSPNETDLSD